MEKFSHEIAQKKSPGKNLEDVRKEQILAELHEMKLKLPAHIQELDTRLERIVGGREGIQKEIKDLLTLRDEEKGERLSKEFARKQDQKSLEDLEIAERSMKDQEDRVASELYGYLEEDPKLAQQYVEFFKNRKEKLSLLNPADIRAN